MRLIPSIQTIKEETLRTFYRFPVAVIAGIVITVLGIVLVEWPYDLQTNTFNQTLHTILSLIFTFPLFASFALISERQKLQPLIFIFGNIAILLIAVIYYFVVLPDPTEVNNSSWSNIEFTRVFVLNICAFLFATFAPFLGKKENMGFWQYNRTIIVSLFITFIYSLVLFIGISLILVTLETLFEWEISDNIYQEIFILIGGIFSPLLFFSRIPQELEKLNQDKNLPKIAKNFAQYILTPLLVAYTIILYVYGAKVLISQQWPSGLISPMVIGYAVVGIINLIILHPYSELKENTWVNTLRKFFYLLLIPLVFLLFAAVALRLNEYGLTENRYYVVLMGIWLIGISIYALITKEKDLKYIPISVSVLMVLSLFGPWSSFTLAENSQTNRFLGILNRYDVLEDGQLKNSLENKKIAKEDTQELSAILSYFAENHNFEPVKPLVADKLPADFAKMDIWEQRTTIFNTFGLPEYYDKYGDKDHQYYYFYTNVTNDTLSIAGFDNLSYIQLSEYRSQAEKKQTINGQEYTFNVQGQKLQITQNKAVLAEINLEDKIKDLMEKQNATVSLKELSLTLAETAVDFENNKLKAKVYIQNLNVDLSQKEPFRDLSVILLTKFK